MRGLCLSGCLPVCVLHSLKGCFTILHLLCIQCILGSESLCIHLHYIGFLNLYITSQSCVLLILSLSSTDLIEAAGTQLWFVLWHLYFTVLHLHMDASWGLVFPPTLHASHLCTAKHIFMHTFGLVLRVESKQYLTWSHLQIPAVPGGFSAASTIICALGTDCK